jgi:phosphate butyryltransferase
MTPPDGVIRSLAALRERAAKLPTRRVAVASATGTETLKAAVLARAGGFADPILVGAPAEIREGLAALDADPGWFEIVPAGDSGEAAALSVALVRNGTADILLKGAISTSSLMRAVLEPERGLRRDGLLSDVFIFDFGAGPEPRIVGITDGGVIPRPTLDQKERILLNAVQAFHALGIRQPKVALLAAVETVTAAFPSTGEAAELAVRFRDAELTDFLADGPLAVDLALSAEAAALKGYESSVAGAADVLLFPDLESANMAAKSVEYVASLEPAHCILGARAPILIPSRSETAAARLSSIAFGALLSV